MNKISRKKKWLFKQYFLHIRALHSYDKVGLDHTQNYPIRDYRFRDKLNKDTARRDQIKTAIWMSPIENIYSEWR